MNEIVFIESNKSNWERLTKVNEGVLRLPVAETVELYSMTADDLSYARTHYPDSKVVLYLNGIVLNAHRLIYKNKFGNFDAIKNYWTTDIPLAIYRSRGEIMTAFIIFFVAIAIGWFSSAVDQTFPRLILGDSYVNMTLDNIEKGDPMAVYGEMQQSNMFFAIGVNNVRVAFLAFVLGILTSIATSLIILINGIMVGAFFHFFYSKGIAALAWSTIMIHGTLELSAIAIAGGAGIVLGNALLYPGTYSRMQSLVKGAGDGVKIMVALIPVFITAAMLESYMTREYLNMGMAARLMIIGLSLAFLIWYFIIYTNKVYERVTASGAQEGQGIRGINF